MPTITSRIPALTDYLVNLFTSDVTLGAAAAPSNVQIYDGPATTGLDSPLKLFIGWTNPDDASGEPGADSVQEWASLGRRARNETVTIHCCAEAWSGVDTVKTVRDQVTGITAAVETLMQADTTQFGGNILFPDPGITNISVPQDNTTTGALARQTFDLIFKCRIGG